MIRSYFVYFLFLWPIFFISKPTGLGKWVALGSLLVVGFYLFLQTYINLNKKKSKVNIRLNPDLDVRMFKQGAVVLKDKIRINIDPLEKISKLSFSEKEVLMILDLRQLNHFTNMSELSGRLNLNPKKVMEVFPLIDFSSDKNE